jgi:hypothetical protein
VRPLAAVPLVIAGLLEASPATAFRHLAPGAQVPTHTLPAMGGGRAALVADRKVSVFVFVRTGQDHSESALRQLAALERELELERKPVRFVAVVSDTEPPDDVRSLMAASGTRMPVLVDPGDAVYGELGVALHPSVGIVRRDGRLSGFQPFRKVNFLDAMRGQVRLALGEIDQAELARILDPPAAPVATEGGRARARMKLARTLLAAGAVEQAIASARAGVALEPDLAETHLTLAETLAKAGRCEESAREADAARRLAPASAAAAPACAGR